MLALWLAIISLHAQTEQTLGIRPLKVERILRHHKFTELFKEQ